MTHQVIVKDAGTMTREVIFEGSHVRCIETQNNYVVAAHRDRTYEVSVESTTDLADRSKITVVADPYADRGCGW